jgi:hypothetical protein
MAKGNPGHGVEDEPHFSGPPSPIPPAQSDGENKADHVLRREAQRGGDARHRAQQSIYEEPFAFTARTDLAQPADDRSTCAECGYPLRGLKANDPCPECGYAPRDYAQWLAFKRKQTSDSQTWMVTLLAACVGGPLAILGAFWAGMGPLGIIVFGPVAEEVAKVAAVAIIVETRPYLFRRSSQIVLAALLSALGFAAIENLLYLFVYLADPSLMMVLWRWGVCTALHVGCTAIAVTGVVSVWRKTHATGRTPDLSPALRWLATAMVVHGGYNGLMVVMSLSGFNYLRTACW